MIFRASISLTEQQVHLFSELFYHQDAAIDVKKGGVVVYGCVGVEDAINQTLSAIGVDETVEVTPLPPKNWVLESQKNLPPIEAGKFYIHGSHDKKRGWRYSLLVDAGMAFGTGHHETTAMCLRALQKPSKSSKAILDMGCGSGILTMAAKRWFPNAKILGVDNDKSSVETAKTNSEINGLKVSYLHNNGFSHIRGRYDLIIANILARPLCAMAKDAVARLKPGGKIILSGILTKEYRMVEKKYTLLGLNFHKKMHDGQWTALIFNKPS